MNLNSIERFSPETIGCGLFVLFCLLFACFIVAYNQQGANTFNAIRQKLHPGMPYQEVYKSLADLSPYKIEKWSSYGEKCVTREHVTFRDSLSWLTNAGPSIDLCFDESRVLRGSFIYGDADSGGRWIFE